MAAYGVRKEEESFVDAARWRDEAQSGPLSILVVNNMPDAALRATERHYCSLLAAASAGMLVDLRFTSLAGISRHGAARDHVDRFYEDPSAIKDRRPDGLIVTGTEPRASHITEESSWPALSQLVDWTERHSVPAIWSCLAAHAAVYRLDGIERTPLKRKLSGVFTCKVESARHRLVQGGARSWRMPHSRLNGLSRKALEANGYTTLSSSGRVGVDAFIKQDDVLQVFFQGHPEYGPETLLAEHRRDVARALESRHIQRPSMPVGLSSKAQLAGWNKLPFGKSVKGISNGTLVNAAAVPGHHQRASAWSGTARLLYANWLSYLEERRGANDRLHDGIVTTNREGITGAAIRRA
jgi:homoserine O-succinyltransferase